VSNGNVNKAVQLAIKQSSS